MLIIIQKRQPGFPALALHEPLAQIPELCICTQPTPSPYGVVVGGVAGVVGGALGVEGGVGVVVELSGVTLGVVGGVVGSVGGRLVSVLTLLVP